MPAQNVPHGHVGIAHLVRTERLAFAAKVRLSRAVTGLSQSDLASHIGMTQRSIHKLEQGDTEPRRATVALIEMLWREQGIEFEDIGDGGFRAVIRVAALENSVLPARHSSHRRRKTPLKSSAGRVASAGPAAYTGA